MAAQDCGQGVPPEDEHEGGRVGRAGEDPCQAGQHHEGHKEVGAAGAAGARPGEPCRPRSRDAAAPGVVLQRGKNIQRLLRDVQMEGNAASCQRGGEGVGFVWK